MRAPSNRENSPSPPFSKGGIWGVFLPKLAEATCLGWKKLESRGSHMRIRGNWILSLASVLVLVMGGVSLAGAQNPIKVGEINSYTGVAAGFTAPMKEAILLALDEINAKGGLPGGRKIEVIFRDDKMKPDEAVKHAQELVFNEKVNFLMGTFSSPVGLAVSEFAKKNKVMFLASEPLTEALTWESGHRYVFRVRPNTYEQGVILAQRAAKLPYKRWANIGPNNEYGRKCWEGFWENLKKLRPDVESTAEYWPRLGEGEYSSYITGVIQAKPEALFTSLYGSDWISFAKQAKDFGLFGKMFLVGILLGEPEYIEPLGKDAPEGMLVTGYPYYDIKNPEHEAFVAAYQRKTGKLPWQGSLVGYITMNCLATAVQKAGSTDTEKVIDAMEGLTVPTPVGPVTFRPFDHQSTLGAWVGYTKIDPQRGHGVMVDWAYVDGTQVLPSKDEIMKMRKQ
jgi:branched-chain amino acid transport system substrate-binding protein